MRDATVRAQQREVMAVSVRAWKWKRRVVSRKGEADQPQRLHLSLYAAAGPHSRSPPDKKKIISLSRLGTCDDNPQCQLSAHL